MTIDLNDEELALMDMLLKKEESDTRVEIHHCRDHEYREYLRARERSVNALLSRIRGVATVGAQ